MRFVQAFHLASTSTARTEQGVGRKSLTEVAWLRPIKTRRSDDMGKEAYEPEHFHCSESEYKIPRPDPSWCKLHSCLDLSGTVPFTEAEELTPSL